MPSDRTILHLGASWYPEWVPPQRWETDLALMRQAGMTVVRVAEFAWAHLEPEEGRFDLSWLLAALDRVQAHGLRAIIGTPTAAPPAWLTGNHPEVQRVRHDGRPVAHGTRCHYEPASPTYRRFCARIAGTLAETCAGHPAVIGFQIDNEYTGSSHSPAMREAFYAFLLERHGGVAGINAAWKTDYWSQAIRGIADLDPGLGIANKAFLADWRRYVTRMWTDFQRVQVAAIRPHLRPGQFCTHNFHGTLYDGDVREIGRDLDVLGYDWYFGDRHLDLSVEPLFDLVWGAQQRNYWQLEAQAGTVNWSPRCVQAAPGETRAFAWLTVGHGADAVMYWPWMAPLGGQEQLHGGLVHSDGRPRPVLAEIARLGGEFAQVAPLLAGSMPVHEVAVLYRDDDRWAIDHDRHHSGFGALEHLGVWHQAVRATGRGCAMLHPLDLHAGLRVAFAPHLHRGDQATADHLLAWVQSGGHLVLGARSGVMDQNGCWPLDLRQPGPYAVALGTVVAEHYPLEAPLAVVGGGHATCWGEALQTEAADVEMVLRYVTAGGWLDGLPAVVSRRHGAGRITLVGAFPDAELAGRVVAWAAPTTRPRLPDGVAWCERAGPAGTVAVVVNTTKAEVTVPVPGTWTAVVDHATISGSINLPAYGVTLLHRLPVTP